MTILRPTLNVPQARFLALPHKFRAFVGGFGSGKTWVGCAGQCQHFWRWPGVRAGYFAPTYAQIRDIYYPTIEAVAADWGMSTRVRVANHEVDFYSGRTYRGTVICRSLERPQSIVGFKIGHALVDELDVLPRAKAAEAWRKIIARLRVDTPGLRNGVDVTTTPEGFKFVYAQFVQQPRERPALAGRYGLVQASTQENAGNLPEDYIAALRESYPEALINAYLRGQFVNMTAGTVYAAYDRYRNGCAERINPGEPLYIGMDFNVGQMAAVVHVKRAGLPCAVDEIHGALDTPDMIRRIQEKYFLCSRGAYLRTCEIRIYPDASGDNRHSQRAAETDLTLLRQAGFTVVAPAANPPVRDRVNAMNALFCNAAGERRYRVNADLCPRYADALEQQVWTEAGAPDKRHGHDHANDAAGYFIHAEYPLTRRTATRQSLKV